MPRFDFNHKTGMMEPRENKQIYFGGSMGGGLRIDDEKNNIKYVIERDGKITNIFGVRGDNVNLYDLRGDRNISKTWKHSMDKDKNHVILDKSMDILFNRSIIYATSLIRKYLPDVDYILIPQSSSDFNKKVGTAISEHLGNGSDYTYSKPDIFVKSVKNIEIDYDWINSSADNIDNLTLNELETLKRRIFKWINVDEQIRTLYGDIKKLNDEINNVIALKSEKRGRPTKFVSDRKNAIKDKQQQIDTILQHNIGRPIQYVDDEGNVKSWEIKRLEGRLRKEIQKGVQTIQYQVVTLMTTNGQSPFVTVFMYLNEAKDEKEKEDLAMIIEEVLDQRYQGVKNEDGIWITPAFPKLIYVLEEDNIHEDSKYYYLTQKAAKCTAKRMVPDYISEKKMKELKDGNCFPVMGCRSALSVWKDENGKPKFYGRFNQGVVTINLVDVALSSGGDFEKFWKIFDERLDLCYRALMIRHNRLKGTLSDVAPILWQHGALARLKKGETIDKLLYGGYSTISLGYAGLCECTRYMTGKSHTDPSATPFALSVMEYMNKACDRWKNETNIGFSIYGTPLESTTYKFAKCLQKRFGIVEGVTDKNYITNSYHVHVTEDIDAFHKLAFESQFQALSTGGAVSYVEVPNMQDNLEAVLDIMKFIYNNIMYAELNTKSDYCQVCGYDGEIQVVTDDDGKLVWECPNCKNRDQDKMNVARRTWAISEASSGIREEHRRLKKECCICSRQSVSDWEGLSEDNPFFAIKFLEEIL